MLHKSSTSDAHSLGSVWPKNMNNISKMKTKDTPLFNYIMTQHPILGKEPVLASHMSKKLTCGSKSTYLYIKDTFMMMGFPIITRPTK